MVLNLNSDNRKILRVAIMFFLFVVLDNNYYYIVIFTL